jgi:hypothetical protein
MNNIHLFKNISTTKDGGCMSVKLENVRQSTIDFLIKLIRENGERFDERETYKLLLKDLDILDIKLFLGRILDPFDYEFYSSSQTKLNEAIKDNYKYMQDLIDLNCEDAYQEYHNDKLEDYKNGIDYSYKYNGCYVYLRGEE